MWNKYGHKSKQSQHPDDKMNIISKLNKQSCLSGLKSGREVGEGNNRRLSVDKSHHYSIWPSSRLHLKCRIWKQNNFAFILDK